MNTIKHSTIQYFSGLNENASGALEKLTKTEEGVICEGWALSYNSANVAKGPQKIIIEMNYNSRKIYFETTPVYRKRPDLEKIFTIKHRESIVFNFFYSIFFNIIINRREREFFIVRYG